MFKPHHSIMILGLCAMALPALAQDTETDTTETPAPQAEQGLENQLDLGTDVSDGPKLGERYSKQKFGDWDLACIKTEAEKDPCSLLQILKDGSGNPVAEVSMFRIENASQAAAGATVLVPLETLLTAQLTIAVDDGPGKRYNFAFCNPLGCAAQIGFTQDEIDAFKRGAKATVSIVPAPAPDQVVALTMSLSGFTAGFDAVDVLTQ